MSPRYGAAHSTGYIYSTLFCLLNITLARQAHTMVQHILLPTYTNFFFFEPFRSCSQSWFIQSYRTRDLASCPGNANHRPTWRSFLLNLLYFLLIPN
ncbi:hypothetical protein C2G38_951726 [Gigaspora rosea]|uniref:Uncharacterized protein n=1 Tax=Gigaspora rosea TaxID=44941 RepID=A0A397VJT7_9GLOM|nr:hypothetical protein C2G38_951726 [Gigaspora rosea]